MPPPCLLVGHCHGIVRNTKIRTDTDMKTDSVALPQFQNLSPVNLKHLCRDLWPSDRPNLLPVGDESSLKPGPPIATSSTQTSVQMTVKNNRLYDHMPSQNVPVVLHVGVFISQSTQALRLMQWQPGQPIGHFGGALYVT